MGVSTPIHYDSVVRDLTSLNLMVVLIWLFARGLERALREARAYAAELEEHKEHLQKTVEERTRDLARRSTQLEAATQVAREAAAIRDVEELLDETVRLISDRFGFYHASVFLLDDAREYAVLRAASSEGGQRMLARGHKLRVGEVEVVGYVVETGEPRIALDVGEEALYFDSPDLPETRSEMALPLRARGEIIGALDVQSREPKAFSDEDVTVLQTLADQIAVAIANAQLFDQAHQELAERKRAEEVLKRRTEQLAALYEISQDIASSLDLDETLQRIAEHTRQLTGARRSRILLVNPQAHQVLKDVLCGYPPEDGAHDYEEIEQGISGWVVREKGSALVPDVLADERSVGWDRAASARRGTKSVAVAPLMVREEVIGTLTAVNLREDPIFTPKDMALVEQLAAQATIAIENARLFEETRQRAEEMSSLYELSLTTASTLNLKEQLRLLYEQVQKLIKPDTFYIALYDEAKEELHFELFVEEEKIFPPFTRKLSEESGLTGWIVQTGQPILIKDFEKGNEGLPVEPLQIGLPPPKDYSYLGLPLKVKDRAIGVISAQSFQPHALDERQQRLLATFANQAAIAIENARLYEETKQRAEELQAAYERLQKTQEALVKAERLAAMSQIGVTVRHEINNPLTAVLGNAQWLLATDPTLSPESREILKEIEKAALRIRDVVRRLDEIEDRPVPYLGQTMMIDIHGDKKQQT